MTLPHLNTNQKESMVNTIDFNNSASGGGESASIVASDYNPLVSKLTDCNPPVNQLSVTFDHFAAKSQ